MPPRPFVQSSPRPPYGLRDRQYGPPDQWPMSEVTSDYGTTSSYQEETTKDLSSDHRRTSSYVTASSGLQTPSTDASVSLEQLQTRFMRVVGPPGDEAQRPAEYMLYSDLDETEDYRDDDSDVWGISPPASLLIPDYLSTFTESTAASVDLPAHRSPPSPSVPDSLWQEPPAVPLPSPPAAQRPLTNFATTASLSITPPEPYPINGAARSSTEFSRLSSLPQVDGRLTATFSFSQSVGRDHTEAESDSKQALALEKPGEEDIEPNLISFLRPESRSQTTSYEPATVEYDVELFLARKKIEALRVEATSTAGTLAASSRYSDATGLRTPDLRTLDMLNSADAREASTAGSSKTHRTKLHTNKYIEAMKRRRGLV